MHLFLGWIQNLNFRIRCLGISCSTLSQEASQLHPANAKHAPHVLPCRREHFSSLSSTAPFRKEGANS